MYMYAATCRDVKKKYKIQAYWKMIGIILIK